MNSDNRLKSILLLVILLLFIVAARPYQQPEQAPAQPAVQHDYYFEPGTYMLRAPGGSRQVLGRVVVDRTTGDVWGFPTVTSDPYPTDATKPEPPVSEPFYLGKFNLAAARR